MLLLLIATSLNHAAPSCHVCVVAPDAGLPVYQELDTKLPIFVAQNTLKNG